MRENKDQHARKGRPFCEVIRKILLYHCIQPIDLFQRILKALLWIVCLLALAKLLGIIWAVATGILGLVIIYVIVSDPL